MKYLTKKRNVELDVGDSGGGRDVPMTNRDTDTVLGRHIDSQLWLFSTVSTWDYVPHFLWTISGSEKKELKYSFQGIKKYRKNHFGSQNVNIFPPSSFFYQYMDTKIFSNDPKIESEYILMD